MSKSLKQLAAQAVIDIDKGLYSKSQAIKDLEHYRNSPNYEGSTAVQKTCDTIRLYAYKSGIKVKMHRYFCPTCKKDKIGCAQNVRRFRCEECNTVLQKGKIDKEEKKSSGFWGNI